MPTPLPIVNPDACVIYTGFPMLSGIKNLYRARLGTAKRNSSMTPIVGAAAVPACKSFLFVCRVKAGKLAALCSCPYKD